ncbi:hypothetical protein REPUB_Repub08aG0193500 [Reevesia pubescens]
MAIKANYPGHDYKVFVFVESNEDKRDDAPSPMLKFECNVRIKYVPNITDGSIPTNIKDNDSWSFFYLPYDMLTCDGNFSSFQVPTAELYISYVESHENPFQVRQFVSETITSGQRICPLEKP